MNMYIFIEKRFLFKPFSNETCCHLSAIHLSAIHLFTWVDFWTIRFKNLIISFHLEKSFPQYTPSTNFLLPPPKATQPPPPLGIPQQMIDAKKHSAQKSWKSRAFPSFSLSSPHVICLLINENIAKNNWFQKFKNFSQKVLWWSFYSAQTATLL